MRPSCRAPIFGGGPGQVVCCCVDFPRSKSPPERLIYSEGAGGGSASPPARATSRGAFEEIRWIKLRDRRRATRQSGSESRTSGESAGKFRGTLSAKGTR